MMKGLLALFAFWLWLLWMFYRDVKERPSVSPSVWIVSAWLAIHSTRPVSSWLGWETKHSRDEGNPEEAFISLTLIIVGLIVLMCRRISWATVIRDNKWLFAFYLFWFMSILWSDYPFITLKRLIKDLGYVVMVLIVLTDRVPSETAKAACVRFAYLCVPLSLVLIKYYPSWGRAVVGYHQNANMYVGVTTQKNELGALVLVSTLVILWDLFDSREQYRHTVKKVTFASRILVLLICWYLLMIIDSQTSLICAFLGTGLLIMFFKLPSVQYNPSRIEAIGLGVAVIVFTLDFFMDIKGTLLELVNRDPTLTTRADIWPILIEFQDNPLAGQGFNTFWAGERMRQLADRTFGIIQAHNGYIETYLNGGLIGVGLLVCVLFSGYVRIRKRLAHGLPDGTIRFVILLTAVLHNYSEASFNKISPLWFVTLFSIMGYQGYGSRSQT